eukprot:scaffold92052_cov19-Tisochrysis_lutea.AAC.1
MACRVRAFQPICLQSSACCRSASYTMVSSFHAVIHWRPLHLLQSKGPPVKTIDCFRVHKKERVKSHLGRVEEEDLRTRKHHTFYHTAAGGQLTWALFDPNAIKLA